MCTWWLLGLALKESWLGPGGPPPTLTAWTGLQNTTLALQRVDFWPGKLVWVYDNEGTDYCMLVSEWVWLRSRVYLLILEVDLGSVLESELGQKMEIWCVKGMFMLKVISSEKKKCLKEF